MIELTKLIEAQDLTAAKRLGMTQRSATWVTIGTRLQMEASCYQLDKPHY
jgi:hypothetical protein